MQFTASHRFQLPFDEVAARFLDQRAHVGRYQLQGHRDLRVLDSDETATTLDLKVVRTVDGEVPAVAKRMVGSTNVITTTERWERLDGALCGTVQLEAASVPGTATITATIAPEGAGGCTYLVQLDLALAIPLVGDRFTKLLEPKVMEIIDAEFDAWDRYLALADAPPDPR